MVLTGLYIIQKTIKNFLTDDEETFIKSNLRNAIVLYLNFFHRFVKTNKLQTNKLQNLKTKCFEKDVNHFINLLRLNKAELNNYFYIKNETQVGGNKKTIHSKNNLVNDEYIRKEINLIIDKNIKIITPLIKKILNIICISTNTHYNAPTPKLTLTPLDTPTTVTPTTIDTPTPNIPTTIALILNVFKSLYFFVWSKIK